MGLLQHTLLVFLLVFSVCPKISVEASTCSNNTFFIKFPFRLLQEGQKSHHMSPYVLKCNRQGLVVLNLPLSGEFFVRDIDYFRQRNCLPGRLRNLSLSSSPFVAVSYHNYTFFSCPYKSLSSRNLTAISCLSNSTALVVAASMVSRMDGIRNLTGCRVVYSLQAPVSLDFESLYNGIDFDLQLAWNDPRSRGDGRGKPGVVTIISICVFTISTAFIAAMFCVGCGLRVIAVMLDVQEVSTQRLPQPTATLGDFSVTSSPTSPSPRVVADLLHVFFTPTPSTSARRGSATSLDGLSSNPSSPLPPPAACDNELFFYAASDDEMPTEDVIIGGSRCISGNSCTICLGDYKASERLRLIRKCNHCFHADCLEQWLQRKNTCPICRTNVI